jgi:hypothetical protein
MKKRIVPLAIALLPCLGSSAALAHVKWFAPYDVSEHPVSLGSMASSIAPPLAVVLAAFWAVSYAEKSTRLGSAFVGMCGKITGDLSNRIEDLFRGAGAVFFAALALDGSVILTPELKTEAGWVSLVQAAIAISMFWRSTLPIAALGILALLAYGIASYGSFHMMDYPVFLGLAAFFALSASKDPKILGRRMLFARYGLAVSLMWAAVEKWAYPQWTWHILQAHPHLGMGIDQELFVALAGAVEFGLGFGMLWTPAVRKAAAAALAAMMAAAIFEFGSVDAIGHLPLIIILISIVAEEVPESTAPRLALRSHLAAPIAQATAVMLFVGGYYSAHGVTQGTGGGRDQQVASAAEPHHPVGSMVATHSH